LLRKTKKTPKPVGVRCPDCWPDEKKIWKNAEALTRHIVEKHAATEYVAVRAAHSAFRKAGISEEVSE